MATITLKDATGDPGAYVYITGEGFGTGETVNLFVRGQTAGHLPCSSNGEFTGHLQVPSGVGTGATTAAAVGNTSGEADNDTFTVT